MPADYANTPTAPPVVDCESLARAYEASGKFYYLAEADRHDGELILSLLPPGAEYVRSSRISAYGFDIAYVVISSRKVHGWRCRPLPAYEAADELRRLLNGRRPWQVKASPGWAGLIHLAPQVEQASPAPEAGGEGGAPPRMAPQKGTTWAP